MLFKRLTIIATLLILAMIVPLSADSISCPLKTKKTYKTKTNPTVYYITTKCAKRPFKDEATFFTYFKSWKKVTTVKSITLKKIPSDDLGFMTPKKPINKKKTQTPSVITKNGTPTSTQIDTVKPLSGIIDKFLTCPTDTEIAEIDNDFDLRFNNKNNYRWSDYPYLCDYASKNPSRLMIYATLRLLKQLEFSKPLPFTNGQSLYDYITLQTLMDTKLDNPKLIINPLLECTTYSTGGWLSKTINGATSYTLEINMSGVFSRVYPVLSGTTDCKSALPQGSFTSPDLINNFIYHPIYRAALFVHEAHHAVARKLHTGLNDLPAQVGGDKTMEEMGAWAAQFYFNAWVALYSTNTDSQTKQLAKSAAQNILANRFTENKCPADQGLREIVNVIKPSSCQ